MKTQAWGWLTAAVLAAGLNSSYHNGGLQWAHEIVDRVQHNSNAVLALATGRADKFVTEARILSAHRTEKCPLATVLAESQDSFGPQQEWQFEQFQAISQREQLQIARIEANRARIEAQVQRQLSRVQFVSPHINPVALQIPKIDCPRVRVNIPRMPKIKIPAPVVQVNYSGPGPV